MRASKWLAGALAVLLVSSTVAGCTSLRTPYEREKMKEAGGLKKPGEEGGGGGGEKKKGGQGGGEGAGAAEISGKPDEKKGKTDEKEKAEAERNKKVKPGKAETKAEQAERKKGQGIFYALPRHPDDNDMRLMYSQHLSSEVSQLEGISSATVLLDGDHHAYVALDAKESKENELNIQDNPKLKVKTEGEIPEKVQEKVAATLRKSDALIGKVYITNNPQHVENFNRYSTRAAKGDVDDLRSKALAEHIQDIWR